MQQRPGGIRRLDFKHYFLAWAEAAQILATQDLSETKRTGLCLNFLFPDQEYTFN